MANDRTLALERDPAPRGPAAPSRGLAALRSGALRHSVLLACVATALMHLLALSRVLSPDEGGFSMVARFWNQPGRYLYGPSWVDRPPALIAVFSFTDQLGPYGARLMATVTAVALVAASAWTAEVVGGRTSARWAAWVAFALGSSALLEAERLNGELIAALFVTVSMGCVLRALHTSRTVLQSASLAVAGGLSATFAVLVKQNIVDGFVFAGVLMTVGLLTQRGRLVQRPRRVAIAAASFLGAAVVGAVCTLAWSIDHGGPGHLAFAMFGFRSRALKVMSHWSLSAPLDRFGQLVLIGCISGLLLLLAHFTFRHGRRLTRLDPLPWALAATAAVELIGVVGGANFWPHYLIALIPVVSLTAGLAAHRRMPGALTTRRLVVAAVVVTIVISPFDILRSSNDEQASYTTGHWISESARPTDTLVVTYTHSNLLNASGLRPGYPYAWSLPARTLDPHLHLLLRELSAQEVGTPSSPHQLTAPTWVVHWDSSDSWGLDKTGRLHRTLRAHYTPAATMCGHTVWLHDGVDRRLAPLPSPKAC